MPTETPPALLSDVTIEFDVGAQMRDGTTLRADVYRPVASGPWPVLLTRTPYGKRLASEHVWSGLDPVQAARQGFIVVIQDVRGRWASDGEWDPLRFEHHDGHDTVEWAAELPGSNGHVGMFGGSYDGNTQWRAAIEQPPSLRAISPLMTWSEPLDGLFARGGAVELNLVVGWTLLTGIDHISRLGMDEAETRARLDAVIDEWDRLAVDGFWHLPVGESMDVLRRHGLPELGAIRALRDPDVATWSRLAGELERTDVASLNTAGWHDMFLQGTLDNYEAMVARGCDARLIVGPWTHLTFADPVGEQLYGMRAGRDAPVHAGRDWNQVQLDWMRHHLVPGAEVERSDAPVRIFVMGRNEWRDETRWPPTRVQLEQWFLRATGTLTSQAPSDGGTAAEFVYDPANPVPTLGGHTMLLASSLHGGPVDQRRIEGRDDVCVFTSEVLPEDLEVLGRVRVVLHAESTAPSTDWVARLCDVHPDGRSFNLCDGILRVFEQADTCHRVDIDLWSTCNVFRAGHRLRVHVTSSSFPRWDRNLNTGDQQAADVQVAHQRIYQERDRSSYIELPVAQASP